MEVWASIDLMDGKVVRLTKGKPKFAKIYSNDPQAVAKKWIEIGADGLHTVDLNAALSIGSNNRKTINSIVGMSTVPIQVGGGVRSMEEADKLFSIGVYRVVVGTIAFYKPLELRRMLEKYGEEHVMVALDYTLHSKVAVKGWTEATGTSLEEALNRFRSMNVKLFLLTSIERDGTLNGPDITTIKSAAEIEGAEIFASGGVKSIMDIEKLRDIGVRGVILGKALYEGIIDLREAILRVKGQR